MLTDYQQDMVRQKAREIVYEDIQQNPRYLKSVVDDYVDHKSTLEQAQAVSNDEDLWPLFWDFDPRTGEEYPDE